MVNFIKKYRDFILSGAAVGIMFAIIFIWAQPEGQRITIGFKSDTISIYIIPNSLKLKENGCLEVDNGKEYCNAVFVEVNH